MLTETHLGLLVDLVVTLRQVEEVEEIAILENVRSGLRRIKPRKTA